MGAKRKKLNTIVLPNSLELTWRIDSLDPGGPRYLALAERIQRDIAEGKLISGMQLPPQRELALRLGVDLTTISRGYAEARKRGLIVGHVGRGTFVRPQADGTALGESSERRQSLPIDLSLNLPPSAVIERAERALASTLRALPDSSGFAGLLDYQPHSGRLDHLEAGSDWIRQRGVHLPTSQICIASGAQHALTVLLTTLPMPKATVLTEAVTHSVFKALAEQLHLNVIGLPMDSEGLLPEALREACARGARLLYCVPTLHNPTTAVMSEGRRREIADIARAFELLIIEDDAYGMLPRHAPAALTTFAPEQSFFVSSLSKVVAPGLRIAYVASPNERAARQIAAAVRATTWMATPLTAEIATVWIRNGTADQLLAAHRTEASARQRIAALAFRDRAWQSHPERYHGWLSLTPEWSSAEFVMQARKAGVILTPGEAFAVGSLRPPPAVRLSLCAATSVPSLERAVERLDRLLEGGPDSVSSLL